MIRRGRYCAGEAEEREKELEREVGWNLALSKIVFPCPSAKAADFPDKNETIIC